MKDDLKPIRVAFPLGIGDCFWPCQKLKALSKLCDYAPIHAFVNRSENHKSVGFLKLIPAIEVADYHVLAPKSIVHQMPPSYKAEKWSTLEGSAGWNNFDYIFCANGHIEDGKPIADWMPELETEYDFDYVIDFADSVEASRLMPEPAALLYLSAYGPNYGFHKMWWTVDDWVEVIRLFNKKNIVPTIVGANTEGDLDYVNWLAEHRPRIEFKSVVGLTSIAAMVAMLKRCKIWIGLNSGLGIVAAAMQTPTLMMWADRRWPMGDSYFRPEMQTAWLHPDRLDVYRTVSFGSPDMDAPGVVDRAMEIMR